MKFSDQGVKTIDYISNYLYIWKVLNGFMMPKEYFTRIYIINVNFTSTVIFPITFNIII